jgi:hypothetical protein
MPHKIDKWKINGIFNYEDIFGIKIEPSQDGVDLSSLFKMIQEQDVNSNPGIIKNYFLMLPGDNGLNQKQKFLLILKKSYFTKEDSWDVSQSNNYLSYVKWFGDKKPPLLKSLKTYSAEHFANLIILFLRELSLTSFF